MRIILGPKKQNETENTTVKLIMNSCRDRLLYNVAVDCGIAKFEEIRN